MFHNFQRILWRILPWCFIVVALSGCGSSLWQSSGLAVQDQEQAQAVLKAGWSMGQEQEPLSVQLWRLFSGTVPVNPYCQLESGFPVLQQSAYEKVGDITVSQDVQVVLYHTHNAETYLPTDGVSKVSGKNGGVVQAAEVFQAALEQKYGVRTVHNKTLHDYPNWNRSYQNSLATAQALLKTNPKTKAIFDIHRDAGFTSKKPTTVTINGKSAARIMLVIGANHDNWKENLAFARQLETKCNELYPGLLRESIRIKETGRYNQQMNPHAVLLEIGSDLNTQEEANYSMECFAQVVYEVLQEQS